jgi:hypothetical protein
MEGLGITCIMIACLLLFLFWTAVIFCTKPKYYIRIWLGVPAVCLVGLVALGFAVAYYQSYPTVVFKQVLGFPPPSDVTFEKSLRQMPTDWEEYYLVFNASDATIKQILENGFAEIQPSDYSDISYSMPPQWWKPPAGKGVHLYATHTDTQQFQNKESRFYARHKLLIYDSESGNADKRKVFFTFATLKTLGPS